MPINRSENKTKKKEATYKQTNKQTTRTTTKVINSRSRNRNRTKKESRNYYYINYKLFYKLFYKLDRNYMPRKKNISKQTNFLCHLPKYWEVPSFSKFRKDSVSIANGQSLPVLHTKPYKNYNFQINGVLRYFGVRV